MQLRRLAKLAAATFSTFAFTLVFPLFFAVRVQAQDLCSQSYLDSLPVATPISPARQSAPELVTCSPQTILGAVQIRGRRCRAPALPGVPTRGELWVMQPFGRPQPTPTSSPLTCRRSGRVPSRKRVQVRILGVQPGAVSIPRRTEPSAKTGGCAGQYDWSSWRLWTTPGSPL